MGIIALKESPLEEQEPLHRMAQRLNRRRAQAPYVLRTNERVGTEQLLRLLRRAELKARFRNDHDSLDKYQSTESLIRDRASTELPDWLKEVIEVELAEVDTMKNGQLSSGYQPKNTDRKFSTKETTWNSVPDLPDLSELPPLTAPLRTWLQSIGFTVRESNEKWLRVACVHSSYLYEHGDLGEELSKDTLSLLDAMGRRSIQVAILDTVRSAQRDFSSPDEIRNVTNSASWIIESLGRVLTGLKAVRFGSGEQKNQEGKSISGPALTIARQVIGAMCITTGGPSAGRDLIRKFGLNIQRIADWKTEVEKLEKSSPSYTFQADGPDHARKYHAKIAYKNRSALGEGGSKKDASSDAAQKYIQKYFPGFRPTIGNPRAAYNARVLSTVPRMHAACIKAISRKFEIDNYALISQCFIHASWAYENKQQISISHQRANNVLAAEGSFIMDYLACHRFVIATLSQGVGPSDEDRSYRSPDAETMLELADSFDLASGVLFGRGAQKTHVEGKLSAGVQVDVLQAVIASAWRHNPGQLVRWQPEELWTWLNSFDSSLDATTQLSHFISGLGMSTAGEIEEVGPDHDKSYRSILRIEADETLEWIGPWRNSSKQARRSAAQGIIDLILSFEETIPDIDTQEGSFYCLLLRRRIATILTKKSPSEERELRRNLAIDSLLDGRYSEFQNWAGINEPYFARYPDLLNSLQDAYDRQIRNYVKSRVLTWVQANCIPVNRDTAKETSTNSPLEEDLSLIRSVAALKYGLEAFLTAPSTINVYLQNRLTDSADHLKVVGNNEVKNLVLSEASQRVLVFILEHALYAAKQAKEVLNIYIQRFDQSLDFALRLPAVNLPSTLGEVIKTAELLAAGIHFELTSGEVVVSVPFFGKESSILVESTIATTNATIGDEWFVELYSVLDQKLSKHEDLIKARDAKYSADVKLDRFLCRSHQAQ